MTLLKKIFEWESGQTALIFGKPHSPTTSTSEEDTAVESQDVTTEEVIAPQFTSSALEEDAAVEEVIAPQFTSSALEEESVAEETVEEITMPGAVRTEVKLGGKTYIVEELSERDIRKLRQDWGKGKLKSLGIMK